MDSEQFEQTFKSIKEHSLKEGPSKNLNEPKFEANTQMENLKTAVLASFKQNPTLEAQLQLGRIYGFIGNIQLDLEDEKLGFQLLYWSHKIIVDCINKKLDTKMPPEKGTEQKTLLTLAEPEINDETGYECIAEYLTILNTLGLHLSSTESKQRLNDAIAALHLSEKAYHKWDNWFMTKGNGIKLNDVPRTEDGAVDPSKTKPEDLDRCEIRVKLDTLKMNIYFFLAQVYAAVANVTQASKYCHHTMLLQLQTRTEFSHKVWAENALQLAGFYQSEHDYKRAVHCLEVGKYMMPKQPDDDETQGRVVWAYARYHLNRLAYYSQEPQEEPLLDQIGSWWEPFPLPVPEVPPQPKITDFESAREEFKAANSFFKKTLEYFRMDGQCRDHIVVLQDITILYKALIHFEPDLDRQVAMHWRRHEILKSVPGELNPQSYLTVIRQLQFDLGDIATEILELRMKQRTSETREFGKPFSEKKINEISDLALSWFDQFLGSFQVIVAKHDEEVRMALFRALMRRAALSTKRYFTSPKDEYDRLKQAIEYYDTSIAYHAKNEAELDKETLGELEIAKQYSTLLRGKMKQVYANSR